MKAVILKGIPASGKTTYASNNLKGCYHINSAKYWTDIVVDNTHINPQSLSKVVEVCRKAGYEDIKIIDMFDKLVKEVGLKEAFATCLERNNAREKRVPVSALYSMAYQDWYDVAELAWYPVMIVDLDWTLFDSDERHKVCRKEDGQLDYTEYFSDKMLNLDKPVKQLADLINSLQHIYKVVIVSGRSNICEDKTLGMLPVDYDAVFMRNHFDHRDDSVVKKEILDLIEPFISTENTIVFDDRKRVIDMWRKNWLYVFNCSQKENNDF